MKATPLFAFLFAASLPMAVSIPAFGQTGASAPTSEADALFQLQVGLAELDKPAQALRDRYAEELGKLEKQVTTQGDLERVLLIREEVAATKGEGKRPETGFPELERLRGIFDEAMGRIERDSLVGMVTEVRAYAGKLEALQTELTKQGNIEGALELRKKLKPIQDMLDDPPKIPAQLAALGILKASGASPSAGATVQPMAISASSPVPPTGAAASVTLANRPSGTLKVFGTCRPELNRVEPIVEPSEKDASDVVEVCLDRLRGLWWALKKDGSIITGSPDPGFEAPRRLRSVRHLVAGNFPGAILDDGSVTFWGDNLSPNYWLSKLDLKPVSQLAVGVDNLLALYPDGTVDWIGPRSEMPKSFHPPEEALKGAYAIASGKDTCYVQKEDGSHVFWGFLSGMTPTDPLPEGERVKECVAYSQWLLVLTESGKVISPRPGDNWWNPPADLGPCKAIRLGGYLAAAQRMDGTWRAWGKDIGGVVDKVASIGPALDLQI
ncbi:MAG: hypothetical protein KDM63_17505, partial [Verrucomicrobiae bacterium]|nr:hypothetical protein [Verrucomicrobiae bacterium]